MPWLHEGRHRPSQMMGTRETEDTEAQAAAHRQHAVGDPRGYDIPHGFPPRHFMHAAPPGVARHCAQEEARRDSQGAKLKGRGAAVVRHLDVGGTVMIDACEIWGFLGFGGLLGRFLSEMLHMLGAICIQQIEIDKDRKMHQSHGQ